MGDAATRQAVDAVWRIESARLIGGLVRMVRDVGLAEDLAQEALVARSRRWPETGIPDNPGAWLMATAKNRALDQLAPADARAQARGDRRRAPPSRDASRDRRGTSATTCCA
jgi:predicted RNA polymerase sigma factor